MRILHLANHCDRVGNGIMNVAVDLACEQARLGHVVVFASAGGAFEELLEARHVRHVAVSQHWRRPLRLFDGARKLRRLLADFKPEIVHAHMMGGAVMARAFNAPRRYGLVTTVHNEWQRTSSLMGLGDRVIAVSDATRTAMMARGVRESKLRTVRNGPLGSPRTLPPGAPAPRLKRPAILTVCGLYERKGVADLIAAFASLADMRPSAHLYIAGEGPDRGRFEDMARQSGFGERIVFLGFAADTAPLYAQADVFVLASHAEPFGLVIAEAREAGCAIIGAATGGVPEVLEHGAAGMLTPPGDPAALADALDRLLSDDRLRRDYARRARENLHWLTCARMAEETIAVYRELLEAAPQAAPAPAKAPLTSPRWR